MTSYQPLDWYDLPQYYDAVFTADTHLEADFLEHVLRVFGPRRPRRVLEPACGSGRLMREMARRGFDVTGFDANPQMIAYARDRLDGLEGAWEIQVGRLEGFRFNRRYDTAHCFVSTFKYLLTEDDAVGHLHCVSDHLCPGGLYVLGLHLTEYGVSHRTRERWVAPLPGGGRVVCNLQIWPADQRKRVERVRSRLRVERGESLHGYDTEWLFRTYDARQLARLIRKEPAFEHVATYDFSYDPDCVRELDGEQLDVVLVLRKKRVREESRWR